MTLLDRSLRFECFKWHCPTIDDCDVGCLGQYMQANSALRNVSFWVLWRNV